MILILLSVVPTPLPSLNVTLFEFKEFYELKIYLDLSDSGIKINFFIVLLFPNLLLFLLYYDAKIGTSFYYLNVTF